MTQILGPEITTTSVDFALVQDIVDKVNDLIDQDAKQRGRRLGRADENQLAMARTMDVIVREGAARAPQPGLPEQRQRRSPRNAEPAPSNTYTSTGSCHPCTPTARQGRRRPSGPPTTARSAQAADSSAVRCTQERRRQCRWRYQCRCCQCSTIHRFRCD